MEKIKSVSPIVNQIVLRNLGCYCSSYLGNDIYFLMESINLLISDVGEDYIKEKYKEQGKDWNEIKKKIEALNKLIFKVKTFYDPIIDKKFDRKEMNVTKVQAMFRKYFSRTASKVALMQRDLYDIFIFLVENTTIQRQQIPTEAFKILEHTDFRKISLDRKPMQHSVPQTT